jgi:hypothetical protein
MTQSASEQCWSLAGPPCYAQFKSTLQLSAMKTKGRQSATAYLALLVALLVLHKQLALKLNLRG